MPKQNRIATALLSYQPVCESDKQPMSISLEKVMFAEVNVFSTSAYYKHLHIEP